MRCMDFSEILWKLLPSIITGAVLFYWQRQQNKRDKAQEAKIAARKREELLHLNLLTANAKLSYAVAVAIKRGKANGEVEEGVTAYETAMDAYQAFLREQAAEHIIEQQ